MEDILASIRRIISDEPARLPPAEPRLDALRNDRGNSNSSRGDVREYQLRDELRARLLRQESHTDPDDRRMEEPAQPAQVKPAEAFQGTQSGPSALTLDAIPSALESELQHSEIDAMLAKLHSGAQRLQPQDPVPDIVEESAPAPMRDLEFVEEENRSEQIYKSFAEELVGPGSLEPEQEEEKPDPIPRPLDSGEPMRGTHPSPEPRSLSQQPRHTEEQALLSDATSAAVDSAFNALAETVLVQNGRTLEDLVREMLRPMLKSWLDDNLPNLVERLVRAEIERVSRGR
jgi:uncharacterized protein